MTIKENPIIQVKHLSKKYRIGMDRSYKTFSESVINLLNSPLKTIKNIRKHNDIFWALKDINFEVNRGEILGIIGRNGAGKTTLLKILTRITHLTEGEVILRGRVGSLLEVGTGFHPELTGRENIYFNGAILGMKKQEIENKFDEIVEFSGVKKFLDTPLKRYSSGMQVRLAFSVAAHMDPEILLIDEVLAVGDMEFQKKCLGKMGEVAEGGRTVLFVSHNMGSIANLCSKTILLDKGRFVLQDKTCRVIDEYIGQYKSKSIEYTNQNSVNIDMFFQTADILDSQMKKKGNFGHDEDIFIKTRCTINQLVKNVELRMIVRDNKNVTVFTTDVDLSRINNNSKSFVASIMIPSNTLRPNGYSVTFALFVPHQVVIELLEDILFFSVFDNGTKYAQSEGVDYGVIFSPCKSEIIEINGG